MENYKVSMIESKFSGSISRIFGPKYKILSVTWYALLTFGLKHVWRCMGFPQLSWILFIKGGDNPL